MRIEIPQIKWHAKMFNEPIHSLDFHPQYPERVATAGTDRAIKIWELNEPLLRREKNASSSTDSVVSGSGSSSSSSSSSSGSNSNRGNHGIVNANDAMTGSIPISQRADGNLVKFVSHVSSHSTHQVNVVRWHRHTGHLLASGHSQGMVSIWKKQADTVAAEMNPNKQMMELDNVDVDISVFNRESWREVKQLKTNVVQGDIYDLQWSTLDYSLIVGGENSNSNSNNSSTTKKLSTMCRYIISGSVDSKVVVWDLVNGTALQVLDEHRLHPVQGIAVDPIGSFLASQCADRSVMVYHLRRDAPNTKRRMRAIATIKYRPDSDLGKEDDDNTTTTINNNNDDDDDDDDIDDEDIQEKDDHQPKTKKHKTSRVKSSQQYYFKKQFQEFFRRLSFSPDGSFLVSVAGQSHQVTNSDAGNNTAYLFARNHWTQPLCHLGGHKHLVIGVSFCPILFKLRQCDNKSKLNPERNMLPVQRPLDYRMLFALITTKNIILYDTSSIYPVAFLDGLHFAALNEVKWSCDGLTMMVVSDDGYCSIVMLDKEELGEPLDPQSMPSQITEQVELRKKAIQHTIRLEELERKANADKTQVVHQLVARKKVEVHNETKPTPKQEKPVAMEYDDE